MYAFSRSSRLRVAAAGVAAGVAGFAYAAHCKSAPKHGLDPKAWVPLKLTQVTPLTENTAIYRFAFADPEATSGMTVASCLLTKADIGKEKPDGSRGAVLRPYTPVSRPDAACDVAISSGEIGRICAGGCSPSFVKQSPSSLHLMAVAI
jgi:cytochrome-b5 reductase